MRNHLKDSKNEEVCDREGDIAKKGRFILAQPSFTSQTDQ